MQKHYLLFLFIIITSVQAKIINVPADHSTIQAAIGASSNGDTVVVAPGIYFENINYRGKRIVLTSLYYLNKDTSYISKTVINGSTPSKADSASCVIFSSGEDSTTVLQGFTITGGTGTKWLDVHGAGTYREGGGILIELCSPTIRYNYIINNQATDATGVSGAGGGGIRIGDGYPLIEGNVITRNQAKYGPGIVLNYTGCIIRNNIISSNTGGQSFNGGSAIWITSSKGTKRKYIENNTIVNNESTLANGTGGLWLGDAANVIIHNNIIWGNKPTKYQIKVLNSSPKVTYNDVEGGYAGVGNINLNPLFDISCYTLMPSSPCIDAGDTAMLYRDVAQDTVNAKHPSQGALRNDIGVYGGPYASVIRCIESTLTTTGIVNLNKNKRIQVFPNPITEDRINISFATNDIEYITVRLINILGQVVFSKVLNIQNQELVTLSLDEMKTSGIYKLQILGGSNFNAIETVTLLKNDIP